MTSARVVRGGPRLFLLRTLLPDEEHRVSEELVGLRLAIDACRPVVLEEETVAALCSEHAIADGRPALEGPDTDDALTARLAEHDARVDHVVAEASAAIGVECETEPRRNRALVDGLVLSTCLRRTTPEQAVATIGEHVGSLVAQTRPTARVERDVRVARVVT